MLHGEYNYPLPLDLSAGCNIGPVNLCGKQASFAVSQCCKQSCEMCRPHHACVMKRKNQQRSQSCCLQVMVPMLKGDSSQKWRAAFKQSGFMQLHGSEGELPRLLANS